MSLDLGPWQPLSPDEATDLLAGLPCPWWIAGGWAIDLHLGHRTRAHEDLDVVVLRRDQLLVQDQLAGWDLHAADPPGTLRPWLPGETLPTATHDIWCRRTPDSPWALQLMLDETDGADGDRWTYRRDPRIRRDLASLDGPASDHRRRVLTPEVQLLHKSKSVREKDAADFEAVRDSLTRAQRGWLAEALSLTAPGHRWLDSL